jgi:hypothetical protein
MLGHYADVFQAWTAPTSKMIPSLRPTFRFQGTRSYPTGPQAPKANLTRSLEQKQVRLSGRRGEPVEPGGPRTRCGKVAAAVVIDVAVNVVVPANAWQHGDALDFASTPGRGCLAAAAALSPPILRSRTAVTEIRHHHGDN